MRQLAGGLDVLLLVALLNCSNHRCVLLVEAEPSNFEETVSVENEAQSRILPAGPDTLDPNSANPSGGRLSGRALRSFPDISTPPPAPPPGPSDSSSDDPGCFSGSSSVEVQDRGRIPISGLRLGDTVRSRDGFTEVYAFVNHDSSARKHFFCQLVMASSNQLQVTPGHMVFLSNKENPIPCKNVKVGDMLAVPSQGKSDEVLAVKNVSNTGLYSPLTADGMIAVNGILASNYATYSRSHVILQFRSKEVLTHDRIYHWALLPLRVLCLHVSKTICTNSAFLDPHNNGRHIYISLGREVKRAIFDSNTTDDFKAAVVVFLLVLAVVLIVVTLVGLIHVSMNAVPSEKTVGYIMSVPGKGSSR